MKTLIWKEWREQRLFFFLAIGIIALSRVTAYFIPEKVMDRMGYLVYALAFSILLPVLFSLLLGATSFTNEFMKNTKSFLLSQPLTSKRLFWTKFFSGLALLFVLIPLTEFVFLVLPFKGTAILSIHRTAVDWLIFLFVPFSMVVLYSAAFFSFLLLKNSLTAIICTPFILLFGLLLILPLSVPLFLVSPNENVFFNFIFLFLIIIFVIFSVQIWQRAIVKDVSPARTIFNIAIVILLISFTAHAVANLAVTQKLNKTIRQAKSDGIKLTIQEIVPPLVADKDNAALVYRQAFDLADKLAAKYKKEWEYMPYEGKIPIEQLTLVQKAAISKIMHDSEFTQFYVLTDKAVNLPSCRFDLKYGDGPAMLLPHLAKMRNLARLIAARTYILTYEKRYKESLESAKVGFRLGDSLTNEPLFISQLVRMAVDNIAVESFKQLLNNYAGVITVKDYQRLILEIDKKDKRIIEGLEGEAPLDATYLFRIGLGEIRANFSGAEFSVDKKSGGKPIDFSTYMKLSGSGRNTGIVTLWRIYGSYFGRPILKNDYNFYVHSFSTLIKLSQKPYFSTKTTVSEWERKSASTNFPHMKYPISSMFLPALSNSRKRQAGYVANLDSFRLVLALKIYKQKHGNYPDMLLFLFPEVIPALPLDPFTGKDYIYRKEGKGFVVYSVGSNERDDNGVYDQKQADKYDDIVWKVTN